MTQSMYDLIEAVETKLAALSGVVVGANENMTEGITKTPYYEVYADEGEGAHNSSTSRNTFGGQHKLRQWQIVIDCYETNRSQLGYNYAALHRALDAILGVLDEETENTPSFDQQDVGTFTYTWNRAVIRRGNSRYIGIRFRLTFMVE